MSNPNIIYLPDVGIPSDGVTDATAALQALVNSLPLTGQTLDAGAGKYKLSTPIDLSRLASFNLVGGGFQPGSSSSGCVFMGSVLGPMFKFRPSSTATSFTFRDITFRNLSVGGTCLDLFAFHNGIVDHCQFMGDLGIRAEQSFTFTIKDSKFTGSTSVFPNCIGIVATTCTTLFNCDVNGWAVGARLNGTEGNIFGGRWEVNGIAIQAGANPDGPAGYLNRSVFHGISLEANGVGIQVENADTLHMAGIAMQGSTNDPLKQSRIGIWLKNGASMVLSSVGVHSRYLESAIRVDRATNVIWDNVLGANSEPGKKVWDFRGGMVGHIFRSCNYPIRADQVLANRRSYARRDAFQSLASINNIQPDVEGKNLCGIGVPVPVGLTSFVVPFTPQIDTWPAAIKTAVASSGGSITAGTYYYVSTVVTKNGEVFPSGEKSIVLDGTTTNATQITFNTIPASGWVRRIYRGKSPGVYDGYFETPINSSSSFTDSGQAFTGLRQPPLPGVNETGMAEPDANYAVLVTPSWPTTVGVTSKSTTGFAVAFGTPAPTGATLDWFLIR